LDAFIDAQTPKADSVDTSEDDDTEIQPPVTPKGKKEGNTIIK
jgi:hypothetical protein